MFDNFVQSYTNCITNMSLNSVSPCTETEIQPLYSEIWKDFVIERLLKNNDFEPINPSVLRSMLVMDLMDCSFLNLSQNYKKNVYDWYVNQITYHYPINSDIFSLNTNIPSIYTKYPLSDFYYFKDDDINIVKLLTSLLKCCYKKFGDIFADNGYEVVGPIYENKKTYLIYSISNILDNPIQIIYVEDSLVSGTVDMFGHSTLQFNNPSYICLYEDVPCDSDHILQLRTLVDTIYSNLPIIDIKSCITSRIFRLKNLLSTDESLSLYYTIIPKLQNKLSYRIVDIQQLIDLIQLH